MPRLFGLALLLSSLALGWMAVAGRTPLVPESAISYRPIQVDSEGYVSSDTCKSCHPSQFSTWHRSFHRTMTQVASGESIRADFRGASVPGIQTSPMRLERRGEEFWAEFDDQDWRGAGTPPRVRRQVVMVTGSHHQQVYWYRTEHSRLLGQLPAMYLLAERKWVPRNAAFLRPPGPSTSELGRWNTTCSSCHTTHVRPRVARDAPAGAGAADTTTAEFGIACEACHGPAAEHVARNRNPWRRYGLHLQGVQDSTIVNPARVAAAVSSDVCGQCHGVWTAFDADGARQVNERGFAYRPGDDLRTTRFVVRPKVNAGDATMRAVLSADPHFTEDSFWSDGVVRVSGREYNGLIESPCFAAAPSDDQRLSCFSCHAMHQSPEDARPTVEWARSHQVGVGKEGDQACLQCHTSMRGNVAAHTRHQPGSTGSSCYNCHMPYTTFGLLKALRSHTISSPSAAESVATGRPNACNLCHLDRSLAWTSQTLNQWYGTPPAEIGPEDRDVAASVLWMLRGDAGQRALTAWSLGWKPAQQASGTAWMPPYLSVLLNDSYDAVRFIADRSLRSIGGFEALRYDYIAPEAERRAAGERVMGMWRQMPAAPAAAGSAVPPFEAARVINRAVIRLLRQRDNRRVNLRE